MSELKLKPCPFCGGTVKIQINDDEGNLHDEEYEKDPWSGLSYSLVHFREDNIDCPIVNNEDDEPLGGYLYDSKEEAIKCWNKRNDQGN